MLFRQQNFAGDDVVTNVLELARCILLFKLNFAGEVGDFRVPVELRLIGANSEGAALKISAAGDVSDTLSAFDVERLPGKENVAFDEADVILRPDLERRKAHLRMVGGDDALLEADGDVAVAQIALGGDVEGLMVGADLGALGKSDNRRKRRQKQG